MPPLVVPMTVNSGLNPGLWASASANARISMCDARCKRFARRVSCCSSSRRPSGTWPAVLHRHSATENRVTCVMQSRAARRESRVSLNPNPSGLTTPAAVTATRGVLLFPFPTLVLGIFLAKKLACDFYCFLNRSILLVGRNGNGSLEVGGLSVEFIQWRFEIR